MTLKNKSFFDLLALFVIFIMALFLLKALFHPGLYTAHDIWHQVARLYYYSAAIKDGQFLPTWIYFLANNYGYPLFIFSYHLPWLIAMILIIIGLSIPVALKITFFLSFFLSGFTMYFTAKYFFKDRLTALVTALIYLITPYQFLTIFVSASIGTSFIFAFIPLIFLGIFKILKKEYSLGIIFVSVSYSALILSHLMTTVMITPFIGIFCFLAYFLLNNRKSINFKAFLKYLQMIFLAFILGILLSAFYLLPLYTNLKNILAMEMGNGLASLYKGNFVTFKQLIYSKWGYGPITDNAKDGEISFQVGIAQWLAILGSLFIVAINMAVNLSKKKKIKYFSKLINIYQKIIDIKKVNIKIFLLFFVPFLFLIAAMLDLSSFFWQFVSMFIAVDYPFRLLVLVAFFTAFILAFLISIIKNKILKFVFCLIIILIAFYTNRNHLKVNLYTDIPLDLYLSSEKTTNTFHEYLPKNANRALLDLPYQLTEPQLPFFNLNRNTNYLSFFLNNQQSREISIGQFDFPGQKVYLDHKLISHKKDESGRIKFYLPSGNHLIEIKYTKTLFFYIADLISIVSLLMLLLFIKK